MAEVTDADREKAAALAPEHQSWCRYDAHGDCCGREPWDCDCGTWDVQHQIAAALAEEREKARAPFLALADDAEQKGLRSSFRDFAGNPRPARIYPHDIRHAAEEG